VYGIPSNKDGLDHDPAWVILEIWIASEWGSRLRRGQAPFHNFRGERMRWNQKSMVSASRLLSGNMVFFGTLIPKICRVGRNVVQAQSPPKGMTLEWTRSYPQALSDKSTAYLKITAGILQTSLIIFKLSVYDQDEDGNPNQSSISLHYVGGTIWTFLYCATLRANKTLIYSRITGKQSRDLKSATFKTLEVQLCQKHDLFWTLGAVSWRNWRLLVV